MEFIKMIQILYLWILIKNVMNNLFRGLLAGAGAWKLGGGCLGTVAVFIIIWLILGQCS